MIDAEFQAASLAIREWALWVAMAQVAIGAIQTGIVYYGIRAMVGANAERVEAAAEARREAERDRKERAEAAAEARREAERDRKERAEAAAEARREAERDRKERAEAAAEARREADRRHEESMAAIKALIEGQAQTNATLAANTATLAANTATLTEATAALKIVVERVVSGAAPSQ